MIDNLFVDEEISEAEMKILTFQRRSRSTRAGCLLGNNRVLDLGRAYSRLREEKARESNETVEILETLRGLSGSVLEIVKGGDEALSDCFELEKAAERGELDPLVVSLDDAPLVAPIPDPPLILHFDSYERHVRVVVAMLNGKRENPNLIDLPEAWFKYPLYYYGNPCGLLGHGAPVMFPEGETEMDWEMEFAAVLGEDVRDATVEDAEDAILGYTIINDWAARGVEKRMRSLPYGPARAKCFATSVGPWIVTKEQIRDPYSLKMTARVNNEPVGTGNTRSQRFSFAEMISYASEGTTLPAGTIICAGPPATCTGLEHGKFLSAGDVVELEIEEVGTLKSKVYDRQHRQVYLPRED